MLGTKGIGMIGEVSIERLDREPRCTPVSMI